MTARCQPLPAVIQGGMGVAISGWPLARAVAEAGGLGVVSGTALDVVLARRLQDGDVGGHVRRALEHFPVPEIAERVLAAYFVAGGKPRSSPYRNVPMFTLDPAVRLQELAVVASFCEVWLAKEGHDGPIGINFLRKIELPLVFGCFGALLAGVDVVLVGAGNPSEVPRLLEALGDGEDASLSVRAQGTTSADGDLGVTCSPRRLLGDAAAAVARPKFLAIVASVDLAVGLAADPRTRPDGFVVEGPSAGGHNAPPRGPRRVDELGQPVYDSRDDVDLAAVAALGLPFWLAGSYGTPRGYREALRAGAQGVQIGTAFAFCAESGMAPDLKRAVAGQAAADSVHVTADWRISPTGYPFKVVAVPDTISEATITAARPKVCDIGALRSPYRKADASIGYRCPAEPTGMYVGHKGGRESNAEGRGCVCNALLATAGLPQHRPSGYQEPALVTAGNDFTAVAELLHGCADGSSYSAADVVRYVQQPG